MALTKVEAEQLQAAQTSITSVGTLTGLAVGGSTGVNIVADVNPVIKFDRGSANTANANLYYNGTLTGQLSAANANFQISAAGSSTPMSFYVNGSERMRLLANGSAVIGGGNSFAQQGGGLLTLEGSDAAMLTLHRTADTGDQEILFYDHGDHNATIIGKTGGALQFRTNGRNTVAMHLKSDGNVGIGTASPTAELHINSTSENVNLKLTRDTNYGVQITGTDGATSPVLRLATINNGTVTERIRMSQTGLSPTTTEAMGLGSAGNRWNKLHVKTSDTQDFYILGESTTADSSFMTAYFVTTLSGSDSLTADRANYGIYSSLNSSATGGSTTDEHRLYGIRSLVKATGDSDLIYGGMFTGEAEHSSGTVSVLYGSYNQGTADPNSGGTVTTTYGAFNQASITGSAGSTITHGYGSYNRVIVGANDVVAHNSLTGCYAEIETDASGTGRTSTNGYVFRGLYDDDSSAEHKFTNFYGLHLSGTNLTTRVDGTGNVAGVYLDMPGVDQGFWNSEDQPNYFRGSLSIGSGGRQVGDTVGAELHLVEPDGGDLVLARYDSTIGGSNSLGKIFFGGTEDSGTTVNFSASIQAFAQSAHSTTDSDGYLSFYTTNNNSTTLQEQLRIDRSGTIQVIRGNIEMATGQGINFSATGDGHSTSNRSELLDDYEEGDWTPIIGGSSGQSGQSYTLQNGKYTKIGSFVNCTLDVELSAQGSFSGTYVVLRNLPFAPVGNNLGGSANFGYISGWSNITYPMSAYISANNVYLMEGLSDYIKVNEYKHGNSSRLIGSIIYHTAS